MEIIIALLVNAIAVYLGAQILQGVTVKNFVNAIIVAVVIAVLNVTLGLLLKVLTLGLLSLGLLKLILDAIIIKAADSFLSDFKVNNFWWALALAAVVAIIDSILGTIF